MRARNFAVLFGCLITLLVSKAQAQVSIPWAHDIQQAQKIAKQQNKLVLVHFWSPDCLPCKKLERYVFPNPHVARTIATHYVPVKINAQKRPDLVERFRIRGWPTDVILTADGSELHRSVSAQNAHQYSAAIERIAKNFRPGPVRPWDQLAQASRGSQTNFQTSQFGNQYSQPWNSTQGRDYSLNQNANQYSGQFQPNTTPYTNQYSTYNPQQNSFAQTTHSRLSTTPYRQASQRNPSPTNQPVSNPHVGNITNTTRPNPTSNQYYQGANQPPLASPNYPNNDPLQSFGGSAQSGINPTEPQRGIENQYFGGTSLQQNNQPPTNSSAGNPQPRSNGRSFQPQIPAGNPPLALDGFCPVTVFEQTEWMQGDVRFGAIHRNRTYLFISQAHQQRFLAEPDRFSPVLSGFDPVKFAETGELTQGSRGHGVFYRNQIFLFADETGLQQFSKSPHSYAANALQAMRQNALNRTRR